MVSYVLYLEFKPTIYICMVNYVLYLEFKPTIYMYMYGQLCTVSRV